MDNQQAKPESQQTTLFTKAPYIEDAGPQKLKSITFSLPSEAEVCKGAEVQVWKPFYYDQSKKPIESGLLDSRMGPPNKNGRCATCHGDFTKCPGHFGYLSLALPVYNVGYLNTIVDILKCICKSCSRILLAEEPRRDYLRRMRTQKIAQKKTDLQKVIKKVCMSQGAKRCFRCGYVNGNVKKATGMVGIFHERSKIADGSLEEWRSAVSHVKEKSLSLVNTLSPVQVLSLLKKMVDEDCEVLYLADRPEKLIITKIAVPPSVIRPSVLVGGGSRSNEDDITERLKRIIQTNASVLVELNGKSRSLASWADLQIEVAQYINSNERCGQPSMQISRPLNGFVQRLKGKQGRFRQNLSAKRVEFTGRTVISPDPNLKITEVGIPILMAQTLTFPERVTSHNIEKLRQCICNGSNKYPGAKFLTFPDGSKVSLMFPGRKRYADELKIGYIVDRHLEDGDIVLFNRQPSLHRMSIMSHRAKIMPWRTLRFNESVCNPYNADFDGDEMNMHVPQTEDARTEALTLMGVQNNLCTPKNGEILVASTQDFLTSSFLITRKDTFYDRAAFSLMCSYMGDAMDHVDLPTPAIFKPIELWTGKQLFSVLVRPNASLRVYVNLIVMEKTFTKSWKREKTMCPNDGFVYFHNSELISGQLGKATLGNGNKNGLFSILLRDYNEHAAASCMNRLAKLSARWIGNHGFSIGIDDVQPGERLSCQKTNKINEGYRKCDEFIQLYNEGKLEPLGGCDAAQTLEVQISGQLNNIRETTGDVCMAELHWRNSPLIMSQCGSKGSPINISQMIACVGQQSVGGRRAPNGFIDRSLPHFPRNSKTPAAKGFVANSFYSGLTATEFFFHTMGGREGLVDTAVKTADTGYMARRLMKSLEDLSIQYDGTVRNANGGIVQFCYGDDGLDPAQMEGKDGVPLNFDRLFMKVKATCPPRDPAFLSPEEIKQAMDKRFSERDATPEGGCSAAFIESLSKFMGFAKGTFYEKGAQNISGITSKQLQVFLDTCISRYHSKRIEAGTPIGAIGAHSIAEPGTQMTLKTFHFAGVASKNVTLGFPRVKEIVLGSKNISRPVITAPLECDDNEKAAQIVKGRIERTVLGQVAKSIKIVMTPRSGSVVVTLDLKRIEASQLCIDANAVKDAILQIPRIKSKQLNIKVLNVKKLEIIPQVDRSKLHFELSSLKSTLPKTVVRGISTIERVLYNKEKIKGKNTEGYQLFIEGTGLLATIGTEGVDGCNTKSNFVKEVQEALGIEAARKCIIDEIEDVMEKSGMSIDIRHMMLLADVMTSTGEALGISIFGLQKVKESVLMLASFEKAEHQLFNAAVNGREDNIEGVSECIIMGAPIKIGTGILKVRQRVEHVHQLNYGVDPPCSGEQALKLDYGADPIFF